MITPAGGTAAAEVATVAGVSSQAPIVGIAADDLTGANDSAVQFARTGWAARLALGALAAKQRPGTAIALVTDARSMELEAARSSTREAVTTLLAAGVDHLYLKIDSTMRGSVAGQVAGALAAWSQVHPDALAIICPAYPAMGRTVQDGVLLVNGEPVATTVIGRDPVTPVRTSQMAELVPGSVPVTLGPGTEHDHAAAMLRATQGGANVLAIDAGSEADLTALARAIEVLGNRVVPVGAAGLAIAMARVWGGGALPDSTGADAHQDGASRPDAHRSGIDTVRADRSEGTTLVVVSSLHEVSRSQAEALVQSRPAGDVLVLAPSLDELLGFTEPDAMRVWLANRVPTGSAPPRVIVVLSPTERHKSASGSELVAGALAALAQTIVERGRTGALVLLGGDGARALLYRLGATSVEVQGAIQEGIPRGVIEGGWAAGLTVVTKAGGFGPREAIVDVVAALHVQSAPVSVTWSEAQ